MKSVVHMQTDIVVADYTNPKHAEDILLLLDHYACDPAGGGLGLSDFVKTNLVPELVKLATAFSVLGYVQGEAVGLVNCFMAFSTFKCKPLVNIHDIVVLDRFRSKGIGQLLLAKVEKIAKEKGACKLTLEVLDNNHGAKAAYTKFGFAAYELDPEYGPAVFYEKVL